MSAGRGAPTPQGSAARRVAGNAGWLLAAEVGVRLLGFLGALYLARRLGASLYGVVGIAVALTAFFGNLVRVGTSQPAIRELARDPEHTADTYARVAGLRLAVALGLGVALFVGLEPLARSLSAPPKLLALYALGLVPVALTSVWAFQGLERMSVVATGRVAQQAAVVVGWWLLVREGADLVRVPLVEVGASLALVAWYAWRLRALRGPLRVRFEVRAWPAMLAESLPLAVAVLFRMVYSRGDVLLLGWLGSAREAGLFLVSHKLVLAAATVPVVLQQAAFASTSRLLQRELSAALALQSVIARLALVALVPLVVVGFALAPAILSMLFGSEYAAAAPILRITLFTIPVLVVAATMRHLLVAATAPRLLLLGTTAGVVVHVGLAVVLIPRFGGTGAAAACLMGEAIGAAILTATAHQRFGATPFGPRTLAPVVAGGLAAVALAASGGPSATGLLLGAVTYVAATFALGAVRRDEIRRGIAYVREWSQARGGA
jgi:O-antigen/teichoic acid export membrane protein